MKTEKLTTAFFRDLSRSRIPLTMIKNQQHDGYKIILTVEIFSDDMIRADFVLFYGDDEIAQEDFRKLLRAQRKMNG